MQQLGWSMAVQYAVLRRCRQLEGPPLPKMQAEAGSGRQQGTLPCAAGLRITEM